MVIFAWILLFIWHILTKICHQQSSVPYNINGFTFFSILWCNNFWQAHRCFPTETAQLHRMCHFQCALFSTSQAYPSLSSVPLHIFSKLILLIQFMEQLIIRFQYGWYSLLWKVFKWTWSFSAQCRFSHTKKKDKNNILRKEIRRCNESKWLLRLLSCKHTICQDVINEDNGNIGKLKWTIHYQWNEQCEL